MRPACISSTVTASSGNINCGASCNATYTGGTQVVLTVTPASGSTFAGWTGPCGKTASSTTTVMSVRIQRRASLSQRARWPTTRPTKIVWSGYEVGDAVHGESAGEPALQPDKAQY